MVTTQEQVVGVTSISDKIDKWFLTFDGKGSVPRKRHTWERKGGNGQQESQLRDYARAEVEPVFEGASYMKRWRDEMNSLANANGVDPNKHRVYHFGWKVNDVHTGGVPQQGQNPKDTPEELVRKVDGESEVFMQLSGHKGSASNSVFVDDFEPHTDEPKDVTGEQVAWDNRHGSVSSIHQKATVFKHPTRKNRVLVGSIDIDKSRWGRRPHSHNDGSRPKGPTHEVGVEVTGEAVHDIEWEFVERYNDSSRDDDGAGQGRLHGPRKSVRSGPRGRTKQVWTVPPMIESGNEPPSRSQGSGSGSKRVQVLLTYGADNEYSWDSEYTIWASYLNAIDQATDYIYIEGQFFAHLGWSTTGEGTIFQSPGPFMKNEKLQHVSPFYKLQKAITDGVDVFVVVAHPNSLKGYGQQVNLERRHRGIKYLRKKSKNESGSFNIATLNNGNSNIYVHSKLMLCDDEFTLIGSGNLNQRSLTNDCELSLGILDQNGNFTESVRNNLWSEHLAKSTPTVTKSEFSNAIENGSGSLRPYLDGDEIAIDHTYTLGARDPYDGPGIKEIKK